MAKFTITRGATVNIGSYESARVDVAVEFSDDDGETFAKTDLWVRGWLEAQVEAIQTEAGLPPKPCERFTGGTVGEA